MTIFTQMTEDFISEWVWVMFINNKVLNKVQNNVWLCFLHIKKNSVKGEKLQNPDARSHKQKQRRNLYHCQLCLTSISSHCWSCKWQRVWQWMAVLWKWWDVKQSVKGNFLPKVLILHIGVFLWNDIQIYTHTSLPVWFVLHKRRGKKIQEKYRSEGQVQPSTMKFEV